MDKRYQHLNSEERGVILAEHRRGSSLREVGLLLSRAPSMIGRERARGRLGDAPYDPQVARSVQDARRLLCRRRAKLVQGSPLGDRVRVKRVYQRWPPEQIAVRLHAMHQGDSTARVSHETIYAQPVGGLKAAMIEALRQAKPARGLRNTTHAGSAMILKSQRIIHRLEEIWARLIPGHWAGDLIKGAFNRASVGTLVERKTRFVVLCKMQGNTAAAALEAYNHQMKQLPREMRRSMIYDRGSEMACHPELARRLKIDIWFCDPHAPRPRGSNENANGISRQFMPKGTDLSDAAQTGLNDVTRLMSGRPRKTRGWKTSAEAMAEEIKAFRSTVALEV